MSIRTLSLLARSVVLAGGRLAMSQQSSATARPTFPPNDPVARVMTAVDSKGGGDETGPYDVMANWPQNYCGNGFVIGATVGILSKHAVAGSD
jgi:hypothetical protein